MNIERIVTHLRAENVNFSLVGGLAVALHGAVRGTIDIDLIIDHSLAQFEACERALITAGLVPRLPVKAREVFHFREEYIAKRNLIAWSFYNPTNPLEVVDVIITHDLRKLRSEHKRLGSGTIPVLALSDLIAMKRVANRPQDLEDIKALEAIRRGKKG